jgi:hypothetical protein
MIAARRRWHRRIFLLIAILLPLLLWRALEARSEWPTNPELPAGAAISPDDGGGVR